MKVSGEHFSRPVMLDISKDGTVSYRFRNAAPRAGNSIPILSVETTEEARLLQTYMCTEQDRPDPVNAGERWYVYDEFDGDVKHLGAVIHDFIEAYDRLRKPVAA